MSNIKEIQVKCAHCGKESSHLALQSWFGHGMFDIDTRPDKGRRSLFKYEIQECPFCCFCGEDIENSRDVIFDETLYRALSGSDLDETVRRYLFASQISVKRSDYLSASEYLLKSAWCFEDSYGKLSEDILSGVVFCLEKYLFNTFDRDAVIVLIDILRQLRSFTKAQYYIKFFGESDNEVANNVIAFEKNLIEKKDSEHHSMEELE